jgi:hypothetical protein
MAKAAKSPGKAERLRAALRQNLRRRKAQAKARAATDVAQDDVAQDDVAQDDVAQGHRPSTPAHDSAEIGADKQKR